MYLVHLATVTVSQNFKMPLTSSSLVLGLTLRQIYSFSSCHKFSIGLRSGHSAGVFHQLTLFLSRKLLAWIEECLGSLSCMKRCSSSANLSSINGSSVCSKISTNKNLSMVPSKMHIPVRPRLLMPAHTCTFTGCFGLRKSVQSRVS